MDWMTMTRWSPYAVGVGIGLLSAVAFVLSDKPLGCSTAFARTAGMLARWFGGRKAVDGAYFRMFAPQVEWEWMLVAGIAIGAWLSARLSGGVRWEWVPPAWAAAAGPSPVVRWAAALLGGILMGMGARWAGGCTSGHGISGTLQLAVSGWIATVCLFAGGIATAMLLYHGLLA